MRTLITTFLPWLIAFPAMAATSLPVDTGKVTASLLSSHFSVTPGQTFQIAVKTELDEKWHTYWRNPGDSGEPMSVQWVLPDALEAGEIVWPLPYPIPTGPIINYGFEGAPLFPVEFTVSDSAEIGSVIEVQADVYYLVCKDICIPESGELRLALAIASEAELNDRNAAEISEALNSAPKPIEVDAAIQASGETLSLQIADLPDGDFTNAYFFPYAQNVLNHSEAQTTTVGPEGINIETVAGYGWPDISEPQEGLLAFDLEGERTGRIISVSPAPALSIGVEGPVGGSGSVTLIGAIIGAFVGGLILNLMPCVFPIISLKALGLAKSAHAERAQAKRDGWAYTLGVLATFGVLVAVLLSLKAAGGAIGWGFQLQNPVVVGLLALVLFTVGLNLIGAFEISGGAYQGAGAEAASKGGFSGSFFTGALAVIVATPCTAPFMATAIGYALAQPAFATILVFAALAIGFAAPFLLLAYTPGLLTKLPKPGPWMVRLREVLSFPMFAAAIWLLWVLGGQAGVDGLALLLIAMLLVSLGVWLIRFRPVWKVAGVAALLAAFASPFLLKPASANTFELSTQAWSPERVTELRDGGQAVFVDFTADWCVTCKVNERLVLKTKAVQAAFERTDTAFLIGDWTNKNDVIARELESYGRAGVPLYLYFPATGDPRYDNSVRGTVLPQVLTVDMVVSVLEGT